MSRPCSQKVTLSLWCESQIFSSWTAVYVAITNYACDSQTQTNFKTNNEWANHAGSILLDYLDSDVDVIVVIVFFANSYTSYETTSEAPAKSHRSLWKRPPQDDTHRVMLNSAHWSRISQWLALTLLRDSHPLPTSHSPGSVSTRHWLAAFLLTFILRFPYFCFRTLVSVLQRFPLALVKIQPVVLCFSSNHC